MIEKIEARDRQFIHFSQFSENGCYDFPILGFLQLLRFLGQPDSHLSEESPTGIYL